MIETKVISFAGPLPDSFRNSKLQEQKQQDWPLILSPLKLLSQPEDKGLGDIIARTIGPVGGDAFKKWYKLTFGKECGCDVRQESWNIRYPLGKKII